MRCLRLASLMLLALAPLGAAAEEGKVVKDRRGEVIRAAGTAGERPAGVSGRAAAEALPCLEGPVEGLEARESRGDGFTVDACGERRDDASVRLPRPAPAARAPRVTIDRMTTEEGYWTESFSPGGVLELAGGARHYYLSDGTSWESGAGTHYDYGSTVERVEISGVDLTYVLRTPPEGLLYRQTDFDAGDHSAQGTLGIQGPLELRATLGSTTAVLSGHAVIAANDATWYGEPAFNYYSAMVGSVVPFRITYTLEGGQTWALDTFTRSFTYRRAGEVDFTQPVSVPRPVELSIGGSAVVPPQSSAQYAAIVTYENGLRVTVTEAATWAVEPASLASVQQGLVTTGEPAGGEESLTLRAEWEGQGVRLAATRDIVCRREEAGAWPTYQGNARHTGYVPVSLDPARFAGRWQKDVGGAFALNEATAAGGRVFVSLDTYFNEVPTLFALDAADGRTLWTKSFGGVFSVNPPAYAYGNVYVQTGNHDGDTWLHAFDAASGAPVFKAPHSAQWEEYLAPTVADGTVYVNGGYYGGMYAFDAFSGERRWFRALNQYDEWTPAVSGDLAYAYLGYYSPGLYALDRATGQVMITIPDPNFDWNGWSMDLAPVVGTQGDVFAIHDGRLLSFDPAGRRIRYELARKFSGQPVVAHGRIYAIDDGGLTVLDEATGATVWTPKRPPAGALQGALIVTDTHLFASTATTTYAIDRSTGAYAWAFPAAGALALAEGTLYIASADGTLTAVSLQQADTAALKVTRAGNGSGTVASDPGGIACGLACAANFASGTTVSLTATPLADSDFAGWSGDCTGLGPCQVTLAAAREVTATFVKKTFLLSVTRDGTGGGLVSSAPSGIDCGSTCSVAFEMGAFLTLTASPASGSVFSGWSGACTGSGNCFVDMTSARSVRATFTRRSFDLTVVTSGSGNGSVLSVPAGISCGIASTCSAPFDSGTEVKLYANTGTDSLFKGWGGACQGTATPCTLTVTGAHIVTASFEPRSGPHIILSTTEAVVGQPVDAAVGGGPGNPRDWVGLYRAGSADGAFVSWQYLNGTTSPPPSGLTAANLHFTMPQTPGTYELRYFADDGYTRLAASAPIAVLTSTKLIASPLQPTPGQAMTVMVTKGPGQPTDWIGLYAAGAPDASFLVWKYLNGGTTPGPGLPEAVVPFTAPATPGAYEFRLFASNGYTRLATSAAVAVALSTTPSLSLSTSSIAFGDTPLGSLRDVNLTVTNTGGGTLTGTAAATGLGFSLVGTGTFSLGPQQQQVLAVRYAPSAAALQQGMVWVNSSGGDATVALSGRGVLVPSVTPASTTVNAGSVLNVAIANGPGSRGDWVGLFRPNTADSALLDWFYLGGAKIQPPSGLSAATVGFVMALAAGTYEFRLFADNSFTRLAVSSPVTVASVPPTLTPSPQQALPGRRVEVAIANGPGTTADWIGLYPAGAADAGYLEWKYLNGAVTPPSVPLPFATVPFTMPATPGAYEVRIFEGGGYLRRAAAPVTVLASPAVLAPNFTEISAGQLVSVTLANGPGNARDWIALARVGAPDSALVSWQYLNGGSDPPPGGLASATLWFVMPAVGQYEFRLFANDGYLKLATSAAVSVH